LAEVRLTIGVIAGTHGVNGELKLKVLTDHPEHIPTLEHVYLGVSETPTRLLGARPHGDQMLIHLDGINTPEEGKKLGGLKVRIAATDAKPLDPDEYFIYQLIGLEARTETGNVLGTVTDLIETGAHDVLVISASATPDLLVPNHPSFVVEIAPERNLIVIRPPVYQS
jgi:16S rRNA processing protein RimM